VQPPLAQQTSGDCQNHGLSPGHLPVAVAAPAVPTFGAGVLAGLTVAAGHRSAPASGVALGECPAGLGLCLHEKVFVDVWEEISADYSFGSAGQLARNFQNRAGKTSRRLNSAAGRSTMTAQRPRSGRCTPAPRLPPATAGNRKPFRAGETQLGPDAAGMQHQQPLARRVGALGAAAERLRKDRRRGQPGASSACSSSGRSPGWLARPRCSVGCGF
jgi:hypothetical protein